MTDHVPGTIAEPPVRSRLAVRATPLLLDEQRHAVESAMLDYGLRAADESAAQLAAETDAAAREMLDDPDGPGILVHQPLDGTWEITRDASVPWGEIHTRYGV